MAFEHSLPFQTFFIGYLPHWLLWQIPEPQSNQALRRPLLQGELVGNHGDELAIGGLVLLGCHPTPKRLIERVDPPPAPRHLDGMPNSSLHLAGAGVEALADARVQLLGDAVDDVRVLDDHLDGLAQEGVALDVGRDADGQEEAGELLVNGGGAAGEADFVAIAYPALLFCAKPL